MLVFRVLGLVLLVLIAAAVSAVPNGRVVGGSDSTIKSYPFMVSIRRYGSHTCGGSIIAPDFVLTAAHCTIGHSAVHLTVQYGVTNIDKSGPNVVNVKRIMQHRGYNPLKLHDNDIALLQVEDPFPIDKETVAFVRLPKLNFETPQKPEGGPGVLAGWGLNRSGGQAMKHLQEVDLKIYSNYECESRHKGRITKNQICGGVDQGGKGQCAGDSGGPLLYKGAGKLTQVGVVSWSIKPCGRPPYPGVYTKVANYIDWIKQNMGVSN